jgi:putative ABC transport system substrate-binding protein
VSELPVQLPSVFQLSLNLKAARTLGLEIPTSLVATADQLIDE